MQSSNAPTPGSTTRARVGHFVRPLHDAHVRADFEQRLVDAAQIAGTVIEQSNHANSIEWKESGSNG